MQEQITNEPEPGWCVTVMRPGTALCSPCSFYTSSPPSPFFSLCHLASLSPLYPLIAPPRLFTSLLPYLILVLNASLFYCPLPFYVPFALLSLFQFPPLAIPYRLSLLLLFSLLSLPISSPRFLIPLLSLSPYLLFSCPPL